MDIFHNCVITLIDTAEDLDIVMSIYNSLEYNGNYSMTSGQLWDYSRVEMDDDTNENNVDNCRIHNSKTAASESFEYKTKIIGNKPTDNNTLDTEIVVSLKYLSSF